MTGNVLEFVVLLAAVATSVGLLAEILVKGPSVLRALLTGSETIARAPRSRMQVQPLGAKPAKMGTPANLNEPASAIRKAA